jgi:peptide deformylase
MSLLTVLTIPDKMLKQKALPVEKVDNKIQSLMNDMLETMYYDEGIGLAANQVGILKRLIVIDIRDMKNIEDNEHRPEGFYPLFLANPVCTFYSKEKTSFNEGCLSVPGEVINVVRPKTIRLEYLDYNNNLQRLESSGFLARVIQHEMDHLEGKTIVDYLSKLKRDILLKKLTQNLEQEKLEQRS